MVPETAKERALFWVVLGCLAVEISEDVKLSRYWLVEGSRSRKVTDPGAEFGSVTVFEWRNPARWGFRGNETATISVFVAAALGGGWVLERNPR